MPPEPTQYDTKRILIFGILLLIIVGIIGFLLFRQIKKTSEESSQRNLFPFDGTITPHSNDSNSSATSTVPNPITENSLTSTTGDRLRIIASYPVTAFYPFLEQKTESDIKFDEATGKTTSVSRVVPINYIRYNAKQNGFLVDAEMAKNIITISQKTTMDLPNSEEVWFGNNGNTITFRSWDAKKGAIVSFNGNLPVFDSINYCQKPFTSILGRKSKGDEVKELQKYLNSKLSLNLIVDGAYGKKLEAAIKPLRKTLLLPETDVYDKTLVDAINIDCTNIIATKNQQSQGIQQLTGDFLASGIVRGVVSPDGTQLFQLRTNEDGIVGYITNSNGRNERQVFTSPLTEWKAQWVSPTIIALTTLASNEADGYMYFLNPTNGDFKKILGPIRGLTTLVNPAGTTVLVGSSTGKSIALATFTITTGQMTPRDLKTLPAKCTWQNDTIVVCAVPHTVSNGQYPDDWYQGNVKFTDSFWSIDTVQDSTTNLFTPSQVFDAYSLKLSPDQYYLYFINKLNGTLWSYRLGD